MAQHQTVTGFFENKAEAQQAVKHLLENDCFTADRVAFSTQTGPVAASLDESVPMVRERSSGRFFSSLFGSSEETRPTMPGQVISTNEMYRGRAIQITVRVYSTYEVDQAVNLLKGACEVTISPPIGN